MTISRVRWRRGGERVKNFTSSTIVFPSGISRYNFNRNGFGVPRAHESYFLPYKLHAPGDYRLLVEVNGEDVIDRMVTIKAGEATKEVVQL